MTMPTLPLEFDHPERRALTDELHARPFTALTPPATVAHVAVAGEGLTRASAQAHLAEVLERLGFDDPPAANASHGHWERNGLSLRWELHTEFAAYTFTKNDIPNAPFEAGVQSFEPMLWLADGPGKVIAAVMIQLEMADNAAAAEEAFSTRYAPHFVGESTAAAWIGGRQVLALSDFRIDEDGFVRFGMIGIDGVGARRLGRLSQRLMELETYRVLAMRALPMARRLSGELAAIERDIADVVAAIGRSSDDPAAAVDPARERDLLSKLTAVSARLEQIASSSAYRFGATNAYRSIVAERLEVIRQDRALERQTFDEFMLRRFEPAMRTIASVETRLGALATRAERAANLLRTRVDVALEAQNQKLLQSMDRRADLQLRLQQTVEGLSVVAISYYAVSLAGYLLAPVAAELGASIKTLQASAALPIIAGVFIFVRSVRHRMEKDRDG